MLRKTLTVLCFTIACCLVAVSASGQDSAGIPKIRLKSYHPAPQGFSQETLDQLTRGELSSSSSTNPIKFPNWSFSITSSRDGKTYSGTMVGGSPLAGGGSSTTVPLKVIPVIVKTVALGTAVSSNGIITVATGATTDKTTFSPTAVDNSCLAKPNNIPATVFKQSPLFNNADFNYGGTDVGTTQATDAFQRANFWGTINRATYHVDLTDTQLPAVTLTVPAPKNGVGGLALDLPNLLVGGACGRIALVDGNTIGNFLGNVLSALLTKGTVGPTNLPAFMFYNAAITAGDPTNLANCCIGGFHGAVNIGTTANPIAQTFSVFDFDMTGLFLNDSDTATASHEIAEWVDDPLGNNPTPLWGHVGQVGGCANNLEVGDPLSGTEAPRIAMPNGFTYHLQELAFFSWFFGAANGGSPSLGVNNWFSNNGTFLTNAGPVCH